jgi:hypothetical protein
MDFNDAQAKYTRLKQQYDQGQINAAEFEQQVNDMTITDSDGTLWQIGVSTGKWFRREGERWVEAVPPGAAAPLSSSPPIPPPPIDNYPASAPSGRPKWLWVVGGLAALALIACVVIVILVFVLGGSNPEPQVAAAPSAIPQQSGATSPAPGAPLQADQTALPGFDPTTIFVDDFSDPASGWDRQSPSGGVTDYANGQYRILVNEPDLTVWSLAHKNFDDQVGIQVDATKARGPDDNEFGVFCRYQDNDNYYQFLISSDGFALIGKQFNGTNVGLSSEKMQFTDAIRQGAATNRIHATCMGDTLTLSVNGQEVARATDSSFSSGDVGLFAGTFDTAGVDILFDDFSASAR